MILWRFENFLLVLSLGKFSLKENFLLSISVLLLTFSLLLLPWETLKTSQMLKRSWFFWLARGFDLLLSLSVRTQVKMIWWLDWVYFDWLVWDLVGDTFWFNLWDNQKSELGHWSYLFLFCHWVSGFLSLLSAGIHM